MSKRSKKKTAEKAADRRTQLWLDMDEEFKVEILFTESTRGAVLVSAAFIEEGLEHVLRASFKKTCPAIESTMLSSLLEAKQNAPIGSFGVRIKLAYAIGLISDGFRQALDEIRVLRNSFAHRGDKQPKWTIENLSKISTLAHTDRAGFFEIASRRPSLVDASRERSLFAISVWTILQQLRDIENKLQST
jgi:DNA-binding MltR family transcriptional regulator